jgi:hypothetical protein
MPINKYTNESGILKKDGTIGTHTAPNDGIDYGRDQIVKIIIVFTDYSLT